MADIGFIGLGHMGAPMAARLVEAGHRVSGFDLSARALERAVRAGVDPARDARHCARDRDAVITMLPAGEHVREVYLAGGGILDIVAGSTLLIDCSTIDVATAREVAKAARERGLDMLDAPVSGGVAGAETGGLTFMVGGEETAVRRARPILEAMGKTIVHAGSAGAGQAAKICNNMLLGISMIGVAEAFALAERLGLSAEKLFAVSSRSSGQCWSLTSYCPVPGLVPAAPSNRDYAPGFTTAMMLKDLDLATGAAASAGASTPLGDAAARLYRLFSEAGHAEIDFSAIIEMLRARPSSTAEQD